MIRDLFEAAWNGHPIMVAVATVAVLFGGQVWTATKWTIRRKG